MITSFFTGKWSPYLSGTLLAVLFVLSLYVLDSPTGLSDAYLMISEYGRVAIADRTFGRELLDRFPFDWQTGFLIGICAGAMVAAILGGQWKFRIFPESSSQQGTLSSSGLSPLVGLAGGFLVMLGLQLAGDSFLGQWSAAIQLSAGAWIFFVSLAVWGVVFTALLALKSNAGESGDKSSGKSAKKKA